MCHRDIVIDRLQAKLKQLRDEAAQHANAADEGGMQAEGQVPMPTAVVPAMPLQSTAMLLHLACLGL